MANNYMLPLQIQFKFSVFFCWGGGQGGKEIFSKFGLKYTILDFTNDFPREKKKSQVHQISKKRIPLYNPPP